MSAAKLKKIPKKFLPYLGSFGPVFYDAACGEPVAWGHVIVSRLGEDLWNEIGHYGSLEYGSPGRLGGEWVLVTRILTREAAIEKYGPIANEELGPRGGFRSVTFGDKQFISRYVR